MTKTDIFNILQIVKNNGYSAQNIVFGMGGGLIQKIDRDTMRNAFKSSAQCREGVWHDIFKDPLDSSKKSKKGVQYLVKEETNEYITTNIKPKENMLKTVFKDGNLIKDYTWEEVLNN